MEGQEEWMESQNGLKLDTDVLEKDENMSTSLCDRFGIHMYTQEFLEKEQAYKEKQKEKNNEIFSNVLHNEKKDSAEQAFQTVIQANTTEVIKAEYRENQGTAGQYANFAYGVTGALMAGVVLFFIERYRKKRNENYHNHQK